MVHAANSILNILKFLRYVANKNDQMMKAMIHLPNNALNEYVSNAKFANNFYLSLNNSSV